MITILLGVWAVLATIFLVILRAAHSKALVHPKPKSRDQHHEETLRMLGAKGEQR